MVAAWQDLNVDRNNVKSFLPILSKPKVMIVCSVDEIAESVGFCKGSPKQRTQELDVHSLQGTVLKLPVFISKGA